MVGRFPGMVETTVALAYTGRAMAPPRRALAQRARPRRGSVERPINARMVRGTWLLVALPLLLAAFTVGRPQPLPPPALPPSFDAGDRGAARTRARPRLSRPLAGLGRRARSARRGSRDQLTLYGFEPLQEDRFTASIPGRGRVELTNLVAVVRGASQRTIVITAHRDNSGEGQGANDNASGTAALVELARAYAPATRDDDGADAALAHARLRLDRRRRVRRARRRAVRRELSVPQTTRSP